MKRGASKALRIDLEAYRRNRQRVDLLQAAGVLSAEEARAERGANAAALLAALAADGGRGRGAPNKRHVVGGGMLTPAKAMQNEKPRVKDGRGPPRKWREGFEHDVRAAVGEVMARDGVGVVEAIDRLLRAYVEGGRLTAEEASKNRRAVKALYYRKERARGAA